MKTEILKDEMLARYLLDDATDEERQKIEERFFQDDAFFEEMIAVEDELRYEYAQNLLNARERAAFERKFLQTPQDRAKNDFAEAFLQATAEIAEEKQAETRAAAAAPPATVSFWESIRAFFDFSGSTLRFGMAAAAILLAAGAGFMLYQNAQLRREMAARENSRAEELQRQEQIIAEKQAEQMKLEQQLAAERQQREQNEARIREIEERRARLEREIAEAERRVKELPPPPVVAPPRSTFPAGRQQSVVAVSLAPGLFSRSEGNAGDGRIKISPAVKTLRLNLLLKSEEKYQSYRATLSDIDAGEVWSGDAAQARGKGANKSVPLNIPANILKYADYKLTLFGVKPNGEAEEIDTYRFGVLK